MPERFTHVHKPTGLRCRLDGMTGKKTARVRLQGETRMRITRLDSLKALTDAKCQRCGCNPDSRRYTCRKCDKRVCLKCFQLWAQPRRPVFKCQDCNRPAHRKVRRK